MTEFSMMVVAVSSLAALLFGLRYAVAGPSAAKSMVKTVSTAGLALAGVLADAPPLIVAGLAFGALGDLALSRPGERAFLAGMAAFALGHLFYAVEMINLSRGVAIAPAAALLLLAASTEFWLAPHTGTVRWPVRLYVAVITLMGLAALTLPLGPMQIGAALFILSDLLLALHLFVITEGASHRRLALALWPAYWLGQALILIGGLTG
ncbi:lysoplasmalogenase family protein [Paracoccaceae bacterium GXU_MW_L88]